MNSKSGTIALQKTSFFRVRPLLGAVGLVALLTLSGCTTQQVLIHGAVINQDQIDLVPVGSSRDQVLLSLGTPSTVGNFENEVFYYISQNRIKKFAFQKGTITDQRVFAVYFDDERQVSQLANYGLQDGKVFDFISRTTATGGKDRTFLGQLLQGGAKPKLF
ncbi:MAG: outer membrane protein assembly factor BamE [Rhizobiaceae bacterium]|nr:outer membrane protein assembly factor BamE [Rhizobiaceae bacterium]